MADDSERLARMQREAQLLAALNHPNIAAIYGLEDAGGVHFLAMELAEGQTLAQRLSDGALGVDEALKIALQIAEALESAHEAGIVHRDLKPANVQVATEGAAAGQVKVLDFGLAKAYEPDGTTSEMSPDLSASPTMAAAATATGMIMGTAAYMSPEQARGKQVDKRTDIWAFGCVVFEILTGKRAFQGETVTDILAAIVHQEPQWEALPRDTPLRIRDLLRRCLKKPAEERLRDVGECRIAVKEYLADPEGEKKRALAAAGVAAGAAAGSAWRVAAPVAVAALLLGAGVTWFASRPATPIPGPLADFPLPLPEDVVFTNTGRRLVAFSPDGTRIVFVANTRLWTRALAETEITPLRGGEGADFVVSPFFSPDGQDVAFYADYELKKVASIGGPPQVLASFGGRLSFFGGSWADDGNIYFALRDGIRRVSQNGGEPDHIIPAEPGTVRAPQLLPGGEWLLFTSREPGAAWNDAAVVIQSLTSEDRRELFRGGTDARYLPTGHIVYVHDSTLYARSFDADRLEVSAESVPVREGVNMVTGTGENNAGPAHWAFSLAGGLVYRPGTQSLQSAGLTWFPLDGDPELADANELAGSIQPR